MGTSKPILSAVSARARRAEDMAMIPWGRNSARKSRVSRLSWLKVRERTWHPVSSSPRLKARKPVHRAPARRRLATRIPERIPRARKARPVTSPDRSNSSAPQRAYRGLPVVPPEANT